MKTLTYTGTGSSTNTIEFPETPQIVLKISGAGQNVTYVELLNIAWGISGTYMTRYNYSTGGNFETGTVSFSDDTMTLNGDSSSSSAAMNVTGKTYTVVYI